MLKQVTDKEPAARKSARVVLCKLKESHVSSASLESWQTFVVTILGKALVLQIGKGQKISARVEIEAGFFLIV